MLQYEVSPKDRALSCSNFFAESVWEGVKSVRSLVEFLLHSGDIDGGKGGMADKEAMQLGSRIHRKIQGSMGAGYRPEVSLKAEIVKETFTLFVEGRADGILEQDGRITVDEIKGVYRSLDAMEKPDLLHLAQAKCYAAIYGSEQKLDVISVQMTYCNLETEEIRRFVQEFSVKELKSWFDELTEQYCKWCEMQVKWKTCRQESIHACVFPFPYREGQKQLAAAVYRTIAHRKKLFIQAPTGVGKTEISKALAEEVFGQEEAMIRVDMSEYMEKHSVSKLIGSPPGYVGYEEGGQLSERIRRNPYSVLLFDEIEKAHPDVFNILLQVLDDGQITDAHGRKVSFKNTVIIMTSNCGAANIMSPKRLGFGAASDAKANYEQMKAKVMEDVKQSFKPEFLNRIDETIVFRALNKDDMKQIVGLMTKELAKRCETQLGITLVVRDAAKQYIVDKAYDPKYGARPLRRKIQDEIEDPLAEKLLDGSIRRGDEVIVTTKKNAIFLEPKKK